MHALSKTEFKQAVSFMADHGNGKAAKLCREFLRFDWNDKEIQKIINAIDEDQTAFDLTFTAKQRNSLRAYDKCRIGYVAFGLGVIFGAAAYGALNDD